MTESLLLGSFTGITPEECQGWIDHAGIYNLYENRWASIKDFWDRSTKECLSSAHDTIAGQFYALARRQWDHSLELKGPRTAAWEYLWLYLVHTFEYLAFWLYVPMTSSWELGSHEAKVTREMTILTHDSRACVRALIGYALAQWKLTLMRLAIRLASTPTYARKQNSPHSWDEHEYHLTLDLFIQVCFWTCGSLEHTLDPVPSAPNFTQR